MKPWLLGLIDAATSAARGRGVVWHHALNAAATEEQVALAEASLGVAFPESLKRLLLTFNGGLVLKEDDADPEFELYDVSKIVEMTLELRADFAELEECQRIVLFAKLWQTSDDPVGVFPEFPDDGKWPVVEAYSGELGFWLKNWRLADSLEEFIELALGSAAKGHGPGYWISDGE